MIAIHLNSNKCECCLDGVGEDDVDALDVVIGDDGLIDESVSERLIVFR